ncbi:hypothetical protein LUZ60_011463 [Juncus effusus]|nr:hypothetical protein LUZ60_011463 [Juncus effusus]
MTEGGVTYPIGIDLGTAYTRASVFNGDEWFLFSDEEGRNAIPSYVAFTKSGVVVGDAALKLAEKMPTNSVYGKL